MKRILLLLGHNENRRLLGNWLRDRYEVIVPASAQELDQPFDLGLVDYRVFSRYGAALHARKAREQPVFLPLILLVSGPERRELTPEAWLTIDEAISLPTEKSEMRARMEILLRVRELGLEARRANEQLRHEIAERQRAERRTRLALQQTRRLYDISRAISSLHSAGEVLCSVVESQPKQAYQADILLFDRPWDGTPPEQYRIAALLRPDVSFPGPLDQTAPLASHPLVDLFSQYEPALVNDIGTEKRLKARARKRLLAEDVRAAMLFPLRSRGLWYGMMGIYANSARYWSRGDKEYIRALAEQVGAIIDNIRLLQAEAAARQEAERASALELQFLGMISHELRTPLTPIRGLASSLLAEDVRFNEDDQRDFIRIIDEEAKKLSRLVDELIDLSRIHAGTFRIEQQRQMPGAILETAMAQLQALTSGHRLVVDCPPDLPAVLADAERISQVLTNLVSNAAKYAPLDTCIAVSLSAPDGVVQFDVRDEGPGIPVEERGTVFEAFRQLNRAQGRAAGGAGLGLAICKGLVEAHGGRIWIGEGSAQGTTVSFTIPVCQS